MMKLVLVRHGESEWNKQNLFTGWMDVDLSEKGHEEAKAAGQLLKAEGYDFDICFTSYLKRAIHTLNHILDEMDRDWLEVVKSWKLNERHYGALQGLNKSETAEKYGEEQVKIWRRSFSIKPPVLDPSDPRSAKKNPAYRDVDPALLPDCESLETTIERAVPYFNEVIRPEMGPASASSLRRTATLSAHWSSTLTTFPRRISSASTFRPARRSSMSSTIPSSPSATIISATRKHSRKKWRQSRTRARNRHNAANREKCEI